MQDLEYEENPDNIFDIIKKKKISYMCLEDYDNHFEFYKDSQKAFQTEETSYTKKIKCGNDVIIFNENGKSDFIVLALINKVRNDTKKWAESNPVPNISEDDIFWSRLTERPPNTIITKVDVNSAYWHAALRRKIIKDNTDIYLSEKYKDADEKKQARLKALGSLATRKLITSYVNGEQYNSLIQVQPSRILYMFICQSVDEVMNNICMNTNGAFFYYWDCVFTGNESTDEVIDFIKKSGYASKAEEAIQTTEVIGNHTYIVTRESEKVYLKRLQENPKAKKKDPKNYPISEDDNYFIKHGSKIFTKK